MSEDIFELSIKQFEEQNGVKFKDPQKRRMKKCFDKKSVESKDANLFQKWTAIFNDDKAKLQHFITWFENFVKNPTDATPKKPDESKTELNNSFVKSPPPETQKKPDESKTQLNNPFVKSPPPETQKKPDESKTLFTFPSSSFKPSSGFNMNAQTFVPQNIPTNSAKDQSVSSQPFSSGGSSAISYPSTYDPFAGKRDNSASSPAQSSSFQFKSTNSASGVSFFSSCHNPFASKSDKPSSSFPAFNMSATSFVSKQQMCEKGVNCDDILCTKVHPETLYSGTSIALM